MNIPLSASYGGVVADLTQDGVTIEAVIYTTLDNPKVYASSIPTEGKATISISPDMPGQFFLTLLPEHTKQLAPGRMHIQFTITTPAWTSVVVLPLMELEDAFV